MDHIHLPDERHWISKELNPAQILQKYKESIAELKPTQPANEKTVKSSDLKQMVGIEDDATFQELEATMDLDNLTTKGEVHPMQVTTVFGGIYGIGTPKFFETAIPEEGRVSLKSIFLLSKWRQDMRTNKTSCSTRRRMHYEDNDNWWLAQPKLPKTINNKVTDRENVYCVRVYRPMKHLTETPSSHKEVAYVQEIWLLGHHMLSDLRDRITCSTDNNIVGARQVDTLRQKAPRAGDVYKSGFFYINGCFYNDTRDENNIDYSQVIIDWAFKSNRGAGPFTRKIMEETKMDDLELRVGYPYVYTHQGNHEHLVVFNDVRLLGPEDPQGLNSYPLIRSLGTQYCRHCMMCQVEIATWVTENNARVPENPFFFCTLCYKRFNFKRNGDKECDFTSFQYLDVNSS